MKRCENQSPVEETIKCQLPFGHKGAHEWGAFPAYARWGTLEERLYSMEADILEIRHTLEDHRL